MKSKPQTTTSISRRLGRKLDSVDSELFSHGSRVNELSYDNKPSPKATKTAAPGSLSAKIRPDRTLQGGMCALPGLILTLFRRYEICIDIRRIYRVKHARMISIWLAVYGFLIFNTDPPVMKTPDDVEMFSASICFKCQQVSPIDRIELLLDHARLICRQEASGLAGFLRRKSVKVGLR